MKPLKFSIKAEAVDHFIYKGYLYVALADGAVVRVGLYTVYSKMLDKYPNYNGILTLAFKRNNFWNSEACKCLMSIPKVEKALKEEWSDVAQDMDFSIDLADLDPVTIVKNVKGMVLDMDIYAEKLLLGTTEGFFSSPLATPSYPEEKTPAKLLKKFDAKIYKISSGYGNSILSLGNDGFTAADILTGRKVKDKLIREESSFSTNWTAAGGIINYSSGNDFQFIGNRIQPSNESPDRYNIEQFDATYRNFRSLIDANEKLTSAIKMSFNNRDRQFYITDDGAILSSDVKVKSANISRLKPEKQSDLKLDLSTLGEPLSGLTVADQTVIEFEEKLLLIHNDHSFVLEPDSIVSMHAYPRSTHFKDILSVTTDDSINLHAVSVFDVNPEQLFLPPKSFPSKKIPASSLLW